MSKFKIFISYRRKGGYDTAKLIYDRLRMDGYSVSFDLDTLESGNFDHELQKRIKKCKDFIIILNPGIFDCFSEADYNPKDDWVRIEIACALAVKKINIVPLMMEDFAYPRRLPNDIKDITRKNSIDLSPKHFEAAYEKMKNTFLISKPHWKIRHKKRVRTFISIVFLLFSAYLFFTISTDYKQKELEAAKARMELLRVTDSINAAKEEEKEEEIARATDSINAAKEEEIARAADSINAAKEEEIARATDSIAAYMKAKAAKAQSQSPQKTTPQSVQKKTVPQTTPQKSSKKTLHWGGSNDKIGQVIFEKISTAGVKKTKCSDNGVIVKINKPTCKVANKKTTCSYYPRMIFTACNGKILSFMDTNVQLKTSPQANEAKAKEELANELRRKNFSNWVSAIKNIK